MEIKNIEPGRYDCPLCGGSNTLQVTLESDKLLLDCHRCVITHRKEWFNRMLRELGAASPTGNHQPLERKPAKSNPTNAEAAALAEQMLGEGKPANDDHPHLARKEVKAHGLKVGKYNNLLLPIVDVNDKLHGLQKILPKKNREGKDKYLLEGMNKKGHFSILDNVNIDTSGKIYVAEGFSTGASIREATNGVVLTAIDAGNILHVAKALKEHHPHAELVICGDDDCHKKTNKGRQAATEAAAALGCALVFPSFKSDEGNPSDFNDLHQTEGLEEVRRQIEGAVVPEEITSITKHLSPAPLEVLPVEIQGLLTRSVDTFGTTLEIAIGALLAICGGMIGARRLLRIKRDWTVHAALYLLIIAPTGDSKSPLINWLMAAIEALERRLLDGWRQGMEEYENALAGLKKGDLKPEKPTREQIKCGDTTLEAMIAALANNPGGLIQYRDEGRAFFTDADKYSGSKGSDQTKFLEIYDRRPVQVDRVSANRIDYVHRPSLARFGGTQPKILQDCFSSRDAAAGDPGRWITIHSKQESPSFWSEQTMEPSDLLLWDSLINKFYAYDMPEDESGWKNGRVIEVTEQAKAEYVKYFNELTALPWMTEGIIREIIPKTKEHCLRFCLILHCLESAVAGTSELDPVSAETMRKSITLARWAHEHKIKTWGLIVSRLEDPDRQPIEQRVAQAIVGLENEVENSILTTAQITDKVNEDVPANFCMTPDSVGRVCSQRLKLQKNGSTSRRGWIVGQCTIEQLKANFNLRQVTSDLSDSGDRANLPIETPDEQSLRALESLSTCEESFWEVP